MLGEAKIRIHGPRECERYQRGDHHHRQPPAFARRCHHQQAGNRRPRCPLAKPCGPTVETRPFVAERISRQTSRNGIQHLERTVRDLLHDVSSRAPLPCRLPFGGAVDIAVDVERVQRIAVDAPAVHEVRRGNDDSGDHGERAAAQAAAPRRSSIQQHATYTGSQERHRHDPREDGQSGRNADGYREPVKRVGSCGAPTNGDRDRLRSPPAQHQIHTQRHHGHVGIVAPTCAGERHDVIVQRQAGCGEEANRTRPDRRAQEVGEPDRQHREERGREADSDVLSAEQVQEDLGREGEDRFAEVRVVERRHGSRRLEVRIRIAPVARDPAVAMRMLRLRLPGDRRGCDRPRRRKRSPLHCGEPCRRGDGAIAAGDGVDPQQHAVRENAGQQRHCRGPAEPFRPQPSDARDDWQRSATPSAVRGPRWNGDSDCPDGRRDREVAEQPMQHLGDGARARVSGRPWLQRFRRERLWTPACSGRRDEETRRERINLVHAIAIA